MIVLTWKFELYKVVAGLVSVLFLSGSDAAAVAAAKHVCLERGCVLASADIINSLDEKVDPCSDFYKFACGGWQANEFIPDDKSSVSQFGKLRDDLRLKLRILLESPITNDTEPFMAKAQHFYKSCMNLKQLEKKGDKPLRELLQRVGGWPVVDGGQWNGENFDWVEQLIKFRKEGMTFDMIFDLSVSQDYKNNTLRRIEIDQSDLGMPDRQYMIKGINDPTVRAYLQLAIDAAVLLGANETKAEEELTEAIQFEIKLANYSLAREDRRNISKLYNLYSIEKLNSIAPNTDWLKYFNGLIGVKVDSSEQVIVAVPEFMTTVDKLLAAENKRVLANYMVWRIVLQSIASLDSRYRTAYNAYNSILNGLKQEPPRFDTCISRIQEWMNLGVSNLYVRHYFDKESKRQANLLVDYLMKEFKLILTNTEWMDAVTKAKALEKADAYKTWIGYPDELLNDTLINEYYSKLNITPESGYFENVFAKYNKFNTDKSFFRLREPNNSSDWKKHGGAATVNAFNYLDDVSIEFPAGILQRTFYQSRRPNSLNFGAIGAVIGHEITHGFDDSGMQFDKNGNSVNWWQDDTFKKFKERAQCIIDQYSNFTNPESGLNINGAATQGENIADNGGMYQAFGAYQRWVADNGAEKVLPGLEKYTPEQLFFISFGNVWCSVERREYLKKIILSDEHAPGRYRVNGVVSNSVDFAKTFNCPKGSPMNPAKKCRVW